MASPPKKPRIDIEFYEQRKTIGYFEKIVNPLRVDLDKEGCDTSFSSPDLGYFTAHLQKFQLEQKTSGLPYAYFDVLSLSTEAPLYHILRAAYKFKSDHHIVDWRWDAHEEVQTYLTMIEVIKQALDKAGFELCIPRVYCMDQVNKDTLAVVFQQLGGMIVNNIEDATFVLYDEHQIFDRHHPQWRVCSTTDDIAFIHWIGLPDSYNTLVSLQDCDQDKQEQSTLPQDKKRAPWHVKFNWIQDSQTYNEWMAPLDYIMLEQQQHASIKRKRQEETEKENKKNKTPDTIARQFMPTQQHEVIIPSYAAWFDLDSIHPIETKGLPEFFNNKNKSKSANIYKEYRDFMVNTYRLNPMEYLTVTACRRNIAGDVCSIIRVHAFLEQWGLINYQIDPTAKPTAIGPPLEGQVKVIAELPPALAQPSVDTLSSSEREQGSTHTHHASTQSPPKPSIDLNLDLRVNIYQPKHTCSVCHTVSTKEGGYVDQQFVCKDCYQPKEHTSYTPTQWTEQEDVLLLEGLEMYPEDWDKIATHVGTKTRDACILHYLKLPTVDPTLFYRKHNCKTKQDDDNPIMSVVAFLAANVKPQVAASILSDQALDQEMTEKTDHSELETKYSLIHTQLTTFTSRLSQFEQLEACVDQEKRQLEQERFLIREEHRAIRKQMDQLYARMFAAKKEEEKEGMK
ncbi:SWIRM domain-containing protein [Gilbertella persicaria]|uniref:SWIRM domain-containing protein n=1 Tax=Gilbertella persicaria TaxID=101096 RepID=UPI00221E7671|nr:SWIRM domain-containing protein [Gilbertella persicaria]KAI8060384.1 SWIRM domain-containing protein [Gilbertella persicaria]